MTAVYATIEINEAELVCIEALKHDSCSLMFSSGVVYVSGGRLHWPTNLTGRILTALQGLTSYNAAPFTARKISQRIDFVSNRG